MNRPRAGNIPQRLAGGALALLLAIEPCAAAVPGFINYQARLTNASGVPLEGSQTLTFRFFPTATDTTPLAAETLTATANKGLVSVQIPASASVFSAAERWLEVSFGSETLGPRTRLAAVPYAFQAAQAATVPDGAIGASKLASGAVGSTHIAAEAVGAAQLAASGVAQGTYGGSGQYLQITVDADGRITSIANALAPLTLDAMEYSTDSGAQAAYWSSESLSAETVDQQQTSMGGFYPKDYFGDNSADVHSDWGQSFQLSAQLTVTAVEIYRAPGIQGSPTGNWTLRIEADSGGKPSGTLADVNASVVVTPPPADSPIKGTFATPFVLSGSTTYYLVARCDNQTADNYWWIGMLTNGGGYANGICFYDASNEPPWSALPARDLYFKIYAKSTVLQSYSENMIKQQGSYSLKGIAFAAASLNDTLTHALSPALDLSGRTAIKFGIRSSRTGANIKVGLRDSGGTVTEITPNVASPDAWQEGVLDISSAPNGNKDAIDQIVVTVVNADADNTFYLDNMRAE